MKLRRSVLLLFLSTIVLAAYLGFADISLPNDKLLHYTVFLVLTALFYWLFDASTTRVIIRITVITCTLGGGIGSEFIQALLPYRSFDIMDIVANILGSLTGLVLSVFYHKKQIEKRRHERYEDLRRSIPPEINEDVDFDMDLEAGYNSSSGNSQLNDLSRFTSSEHLPLNGTTGQIPLKNVDPEPIDDMEVE